MLPRKLALTLTLIALTACTGAPAPANTPVPTQANTQAPAATNTPASDPTATAPSVITPTDQPTVEPTAAGPVAYGPFDFPPNVNPLTGLVVADPAILARRPLAVKVSQFPRVVRPQSGLSLADLVFEHYAEAGVTRMTAIFLGQEAEQIGSIRSARLIDVVLAESYKAMLVTSGSSAGTLNRFSKTNFYDRVIAEATGFDRCPPLCRQGEAASTNNLFASTAGLWQTTTDLGLNAAQKLEGMAFAEIPPAGGVTIDTVHIDFQLNNNVVEWRYDAATGRYVRWVDTDKIAQGELAPHTEALTGEALTSANVVILYANHVTTDIVEDYGEQGHCGYEVQVWGAGPAKVFRNGQMYEATWVRFKTDEVIGLVDAANQPLPLAPGNTWFELIDLDSPTDTAAPATTFKTRFKGPSQTQGCPVNQ